MVMPSIELVKCEIGRVTNKPNDSTTIPEMIVLSQNPNSAEYYLDRRKRSKEIREKKIISLSEQKRKKELEEADQWRLELENKLRLSKGKPPLEKLSDLDEDEAEEAHLTQTEIDVDDPLMIEAGEVVVDFIELLVKNIVNR